MTVGAMRMTVLSRDGGCVAPRIDPDAGPCFDAWGRPHPGGLRDVEMDYVPPVLGTRQGRHGSADDHVTLCPGHHRGTGPSGGYVWATANRRALRDYLERVRWDAPGGSYGT